MNGTPGFRVFWDGSHPNRPYERPTCSDCGAEIPGYRGHHVCALCGGTSVKSLMFEEMSAQSAAEKSARHRPVASPMHDVREDSWCMKQMRARMAEQKAEEKRLARLLRASLVVKEAA